MLLALVCVAMPANGESQPPRTADSRLSAALAATLRDAAREPPLAAVYDSAPIEPVWFTEGRARPAVALALATLTRAAEHGLSPADYGTDALQGSVDAARRPDATPSAVAHADVALTAAMLRYLGDLSRGRVPPHIVAPHYRVPLPAVRFHATLRAAVARDRLADVLASAEPQYALYGQLRSLLATYRALAGEAPLSLPGPPDKRLRITAGDRYAQADTLAALLRRSGDLAGDAQPPGEYYTDALAAALQRFQRRHGLAADGVLGRETLAALNVPPAARATQIELALERLRWLPPPARGPLVAINIPSFHLWALTDATAQHSPALRMPVIVGTAVRTETPVFAGTMERVELSPAWNVPRSILRNELLPRLAQNRALLAREGMEVVGADGRARDLGSADDATLAALHAGAARLRQRPGPRNALGGVKFVLPNAMSIYLHGTPAQQLFAPARRDFSHGCIRVGDPLALAQFVLRDDPAWSRARLEAAMRAGTPRVVALRSPVPVLVFYVTALVDAQGRAQFLPDLYGHDAQLAAALRKARPARRYQRRTVPVSRCTNAAWG